MSLPICNSLKPAQESDTNPTQLAVMTSTSCHEALGKVNEIRAISINSLATPLCINAWLRSPLVVVVVVFASLIVS